MVGIHVNSNKVKEREVLEAVNIGSILGGFKTFITDQLGGRTENELWLEKIAHFPKNEFHLSGIPSECVPHERLGHTALLLLLIICILLLLYNSLKMF